jgi:Gram-negative bacterial TonB protein C-terminal
VRQDAAAAKALARNHGGRELNTLLAFLFSFLLFADTPVTADAPPIVQMPRVTHFLAPSYPEVAWQAKVHGKVVLKILVYKDGRFSFTETPAGPPALVSAAKENLCSWTFAANQSETPLPLTVEYEYLIDKTRSSAQLNAEVTCDLPNHVTVVAPEYSPSCSCVKKRSKWRLF